MKQRKIGILSPSSPSNEKTKKFDEKEQFEKGLETLAKLGFECILGAHTKDALHYVSAPIKERLQDLHGFYRDPDIRLIIAANGGHNINQLLPELDFKLIAESPGDKPLVGFSDITILLNAIYARTGKVQIHGPMVTWGFHNDKRFTNRHFLRLIKREQVVFSLPEFGRFLRTPVPMQGTLVGGDIFSLENLLGTKVQPDWRKKIFFWEAADEDVSILDRTLTHFKTAGVWNKIGGMIIGHLHEINEYFCVKKHGPIRPVWDMINEHFASYTFPILHTERFGHDLPSQISIPVGGVIDVRDDIVEIRTHPIS